MSQHSRSINYRSARVTVLTPREHCTPPSSAALRANLGAALRARLKQISNDSMLPKTFLVALRLGVFACSGSLRDTGADTATLPHIQK